MVFGHRRATECERSRPLLSAHVDRRLSPAEENALEAHLATCEACAEHLRALRLTVDLLGQLPHVPVPRSFLLEAPAPVPHRPFLWYYYFRNASGAVAALLVALLAFSYVMQAALPVEMRSAAPRPAAGSTRGAAESSAPVQAEQANEVARPAAPEAPMKAAGERAAASTPSPAAADGGAAPAAPVAAAPPAKPAPAPTAGAAALAAAPASASPETPATAVAAGPTVATAPPSGQLARDRQAEEPAADPAATLPIAARSWPMRELEWGLGVLLGALAVATIILRGKAA